MESRVSQERYEQALDELFTVFKSRQKVAPAQTRDLRTLEEASLETIKRGVHNYLLLAAPIAVGKSSIGKVLETKGLQRIVRTTNRRPRPGERDGVDYFFLDSNEFDKQLEDGRLIIPSEVGSTRWATDKMELDRRLQAGPVMYMECGVQTLIQAKQLPGRPLGTFILPPSFEVWMDRINARKQDGMDEVEIHRRAEQSLWQITQSAQCADLYVVNDEVSRVSTLLAGIFS